MPHAMSVDLQGFAGKWLSGEPVNGSTAFHACGQGLTSSDHPNGCLFE